MADVVIDASAVRALGSRVRTTHPVLELTVPELDAGQLGADAVADALAQVREERVARAEIVRVSAAAAADRPDNVAASASTPPRVSTASPARLCVPTATPTTTGDRTP